MRKNNPEFFEAYLVRPLVLLGVYILLIHTPIISVDNDSLFALGIIFECIGLFFWNKKNPVSYNIKKRTLFWIRIVAILIFTSWVAFILLEPLFKSNPPDIDMSKSNPLDIKINLDDLKLEF